MHNYNNCRTMICLNPNSRFRNILSNDVIDGKRTIGFVFYEDSEISYFPLNTSLYELKQDGWVDVTNELGKKLGVKDA